MIGPWTSAEETASLVRSGEMSAVEVAREALARIAAGDGSLNSFTTVTTERALAEAEAVDAARTKGRALPPLAGVPYAVKNLFDLEGVVTVAGSKIEREKPPAGADAFLVQRMHAAGAVCVGALNMDEYAYGFTTENAHDGPCHNPHDLTRSAGGSSGGCGASVAGGLVPLSLGSDTNGSIRVPASLCGIFGLKPTYGRLARTGSYMFVTSLDHLGPFARTVGDLAAAWDALQGYDPADPAQRPWPVEPATPLQTQGVDGLRLAVADDYFARNGHPVAFAAVAAVAAALHVERRITVPEAARARAAAFLITAAEGANLHRSDLIARPQDFDPGTRDRFLAGSLVPAGWVVQAQRFRAWYRARVLELFRDVDVILAPATPYAAPRLGQQTIEVDGQELPVRPMLGVYTQPISCIGLPVIAVPVPQPDGLPIGVQLIAAPGREDVLFRVAAALEQAGAVRSPEPGG
ncbi:MAG: AtzE family amidohydrolase [Geminicoccaceae bacterium]